MCRSQQVSEVAEDSEGSVEECDQISEGVGSCSEFEVMSIQTYQPEKGSKKKDRLPATSRYESTLFRYKKINA